MLDDIQSQMSQNDLSSTQLFRSNADYFNNSRFKTSSNSMDSSSFVTQASTPNSFASQGNQKESEWFVSSSQRTQSRYLQPSLLYDEEEADNAHEVVAQDSPELFTQHSDFHLRGAPFNASELDMEDSEGTIALLCCALKMSYNRQRLLGFPELVLLHCIAWC